MLIGILQTGHVPPALEPAFDDYPQMFMQLLDGHGFTFRTWAVVDMDFPADIHAADGWLLTGSRHGAYDDLPFIAPLEAFIRDAHAAHVPMVGICFGHQIIAQALGGRVEKFGDGWAVGPQDYDFDGERITLQAWHQDQVTAPPPGARIIAHNDFCANAGMAIGDHILTVQAHPEYGDDFIEGLIDTRAKGVVPDDQRAAARAALGRPLDRARVADRIATFFKQNRGQDE